MTLDPGEIIRCISLNGITADSIKSRQADWCMACRGSQDFAQVIDAVDLGDLKQNI